MNGGAEAAAPARLFRPTPPTIVRYVLRELAVPTLIGFGLFTFFLLMNFLLQLAELMIRDRVAIADVGRFFIYNVPHVIVLTVPMAVLVGGLVAFGRMSSDSEIVALRSGGVSLYQLAVPILLLASAATILNLYLCIRVLPWGNTAIIELTHELSNARTLSAQIRPRVFETRFPGLTLLVDDMVGANSDWLRLFVADAHDAPPRIIVAERAALRVDETNDDLWLELGNGYIYEEGGTPEESSITYFEGQEELVMRGTATTGTLAKDDRSMSIPELRRAIAVREQQGLQALGYRVEIQKRFSIPIACLVMGLIALPLGISTQRHTKATGYLIAIGIIAVYYQFIENGEKFAEQGVIPVWMGMWGGNIVLGAVALLLLWMKAREKELGVADRLLRGVDSGKRLAAGLWHRLRDEDAVAPAARASVASNSGGRDFPRILDLLVLREFARIFVLTGAALSVLWMITEYFEIADDVYEAGASRWVIVEYFQFRLPFIFMMTLPIATILTVLIVFSLMSKHNEVVAVLAGGTSLFRLAAPVLVPALALTAGEYAVSDYIVPYTNLRLAAVQEKIDLDAKSVDPTAQAHWARGEGRHFFYYADYDPEARTFQDLYVFHFDPEVWRLSRVDHATRATWRDGAWQVTDAWRRHYEYRDGEVSSPALQRYPSGAPLHLAEEPAYFGTERRLPDQMSANELRHHIDELEQKGFDATKYRIDLQQKLAFPFVVFVLALVGIPFGFRMGRQGTLSGVAVALTLTVLFWLTFVFFRAVGSAGMLPPLVAAWSPHVLFLALAGYITLGLRT